MNEAHASLAHRAGVIATVVLWTLLSVLALGLPNLVHLANSTPSPDDPDSTLLKQILNLGDGGLLFASSALVTSLLLVRFARIRKLWHAAILAVAAFGLFVLSSYSLPWGWLMSTLLNSFDWHPSDYPAAAALRVLWGAVHAAQIAIVFCGYRMIGWRLHDAKSMPGPAPAEAPPAGSRGAWSGTRKEWRAFSIVLACVALLVAAWIITVRVLLGR